MAIRNILLFLLLITLSACAPSVVHRYDGPVRDLDKVAVIYHNTERNIYIFMIDGVNVQNRFTTFNPDGWNEAHLEPGWHTLSGSLYINEKSVVFNKRYFFEAGKKYRLMHTLSEDRNKASFYLDETE